MEVINIFLAGSTKLVKERELIRSCANKLQADNCAKGRDIAINITTFENFSGAITDVKAQEQYDDYIHSEADFAMFVFDNHVGKISKHEFEVAYDAFCKNKRPSLYIYFQKAETYSSDYAEIRTLLEHTNNYFQEYEDIYHLSRMIETHLREIIEPRIEKIIIDTHKDKGYVTILSECPCVVMENDDDIAAVDANVPCELLLTEGLHVLKFSSTDSSESFERTVRVIKDVKRKIYVQFPSHVPPKPARNTIYYIISAIVLALVISICLLPKPHYDEYDNYLYEEIENIGSDKYQLALDAMERGDYTKAVELFKTVINSEPEFPDAYIHLASIYIDQGEWDKANDLLVTALELNPDSHYANQLYDSIN